MNGRPKITSTYQRCGTDLMLAFIKRDFLIEKTYRFHLALKIGAMVLQLAIFYFISVYVGKPEYFPFVFVGLMFSAFFQFWLNVFAENIRQEQYWGTMERVFLCPRRPLSVMASSVSGKTFILLLEIAAMLLIGKMIFGTDLAGPLKILTIFLPLIILNAFVFGGLGLISGSFIMYFKRGDPVNWVMGALFDLLSGVYFPVAVFPDALKVFSEKLPTTSALNMWRTALLAGKPPEIAQYLAQFGWAVLLFGLGVAASKISFDRIRAKGELGTY